MGATVPLYDAGVRAPTLAQADADSAEAMLTRRRNEGVRQIVLSDNALCTSLSAYSASQALASAAKTTFDARACGLSQWRGINTDVTIVQRQHLQVRNSSTVATREYLFNGLGVRDGHRLGDAIVCAVSGKECGPTNCLGDAVLCAIG